MIGILVILLFSWLILHFAVGESLAALGATPWRKRLKQFLSGFLLTALLCVGVHGGESLLTKGEWQFNEAMQPQLLLEMFWWDFRSVLTEELVFRGALLIILMRKLGTTPALLISAASFGIFHWFSFGLWGNMVAMIVIFMGTGLMGYALALSVSRSHSILMALGFHLGWNFSHNSIFSSGPLGRGLLSYSSETPVSNWYSLVGLLLVPLLVLLYVRHFVAQEAAHPPRPKSQRPLSIRKLSFSKLFPRK